MADLQISNYLFGILIFVFFIVGGLAIINGFNESQPSYVAAGTDTQMLQAYNNSFNKMNEINAVSADLASKLAPPEPTDPLTKILGFFNFIFFGAYSAIYTIFASLGFMNGVFIFLGTSFFGIPAWIPVLIISGVTIYIAFALFGLVFNRNP